MVKNRGVKLMLHLLLLRRSCRELTFPQALSQAFAFVMTLALAFPLVLVSNHSASAAPKAKDEYLYHCVKMKFVRQDKTFKKWKQCVGKFEIIPGKKTSKALPTKQFSAEMVRKPTCPDEGLQIYADLNPTLR